MKRALVLCTGNSCRSQMAEALWNDLGRGAWTAVSAGSNPAGYVHPLAVAAVGELGLDLSAGRSKHLDEFRGEAFDAVVTVCDNARDSCPAWAGAARQYHWPFRDPAHATGTDGEKMATFREVRDEIRDRIAAFLKTGE